MKKGEALQPIRMPVTFFFFKRNLHTTRKRSNYYYKHLVLTLSTVLKIFAIQTLLQFFFNSHAMV